MDILHVPVLTGEVLQYLIVKPVGIYVDGTLGEGGHTKTILEATGSQVKVLAMDRDGAAIERSRRRLAAYESRIIWVRENFKNLPEVLKGLSIARVDGVLWDLGLCSAQLADSARGFSFQEDGELDMRQDQRQEITAAELVNNLPEAELARIINQYGEERWGRRIAGAIVSARQSEYLNSTCRLAEIIKRAIPAAYQSRKINPATKTFQALRIAVNQELEGLDSAIVNTVEVLSAGARFCIISYHSLEDRLVKQTFRSLTGACTCPPKVPVCSGHTAKVRILTPHPLTPAQGEVEANPRARSAKMRVAQRIAESGPGANFAGR